MTKKLIFARCILFFFTIIICPSVVGQKVTKKPIPLAILLDEISNKYKIFFTYDASLISNKLIHRDGFIDLSLQESISLLKKITSFYFDDLGNSYYVIYAKKDTSKKEIETLKNQMPTTTDNLFFEDKIRIKGIVLNSENQPLSGATLQDKKSLIGTTTDEDGMFQFEIPKDNMVTISFLGHTSEILQLIQNKFHSITLVSGQELDEVHIVGSRNKNRVADDTPVAIDFIDIEKNSTKSSQTEINQFLQYVIPSFNATKQSGSDGADHIDPATIRGLGPDQTLVLINGKRRHQASLINLHGTRGRGNSGTDLNAIPISAIKRIELLRDGASAQYGSDAIAGVLNIVLKDTDDQLSVFSTFGLYNANEKNSLALNNTDGHTYKLALNYGTKIAKKGFVNLSTEILSTDNTFRSRSSSREKFGQAALKNGSFFINSEIPLYNHTKLYAYGGINYRNTEAFAFTRQANSERNVISIYKNGFNPLITSVIIDNSLSVGLTTNFKGWNTDINHSLGRNNFKYLIKNTLNATLEKKSPTEFDAGGHQLTQNTTSIDFSKYFLSASYGLNIALGLEYRLDRYKIFSGEEASYKSYDVYGNGIDAQTPMTDYTTYNGIIRPGGAQGFPGYSKENEVDRDRSNIGMYIDTEIDFSKKFMVATALRYESYSDFGNTLNFKLASRYKISPKWNIRSSFSTGFRAPSLAQIYYNLTFTNFEGNTPNESLLVANNSPIARKFYINPLKEEKAKNISLGLTAKLTQNFNLAIDGYYTSITDRIILSGRFDTSHLEIDVSSVQFFVNGVDTETIGLDIILNWKKQLQGSTISLDFLGNINHMDISKIKNKSLDRETFFGIRDQQFLLSSAPKSKFSLGINYEYKKLKTSFSFTRFSKVKLIDWQIYRDLSNFNNSKSQRLEVATDIYQSKITTDAHFNYQLSNTIEIQLGANNLLNIYPSKQNDNYTDSGGLWDSVQMGTNGAFYYTKLNLNL